ncbi:MAG: TM2 domain-containing protein [Bacteroidota bacterium]
MLNKLIRQFFFITTFSLLCFKGLQLHANNFVMPDHNLVMKNILQFENYSESQNRPNPLLQIFNKHKSKNKKITAAILAFPLPFGIVGLHRIYLGCAPFVPVVYIASLGGAFGILPLIDFFVILKEEDISKFNNSDQVFMWVE